MSSPRQGGWERFKGFSSHDHWVTHGCLFEEFEFFGDVPGEFIVVTYNTILSHRGYYNDFHCSLLLEKTEKYIVFALASI